MKERYLKALFGFAGGIAFTISTLNLLTGNYFAIVLFCASIFSFYLAAKPYDAYQLQS